MPTVLVTGANRGIGFEFAKQYAGEGWRVLACCRNPAKAPALDKLAKESRGMVSVHGLDVTDGAAIRGLAQELKSEPIDLLINNAGVSGRDAGDLGAFNVQAWLNTLAINTIAPAELTAAFADNVARSGRKIVVTISSVLGSIAENNGGMYAYRSSKAAVNAVTKSLSNDLKGKGIIAVCLHPGWVQTDMGGPSAPVKPHESVTGLRKVIGGLKPADSGHFYSFEGRQIPW
ncbi:MAG TPA: SDR family oxidoreductase [Candidatus Cybelea sp.]|nr:SDR family oxidoreductase [Candidatus Cybelea sp.]